MARTKKLVTVVGARPQFVKAAVVSRSIRAHPCLEEILVHTGQHFDDRMSKVFFDEMGIPAPAHQLTVHSLPHGAMTGRMLEGIEQVLQLEKPDGVLVYGDTNSTLAGALAARKLHIPVCHVEAGLRSRNMAMPEEVNRIVTDRVSDILFCPTRKAVENLEAEGFRAFPCRLVLSGDVMLDAARYYEEHARSRSSILERLALKPGAFALCTIHRAENTDDPRRLADIASALESISEQVPVVVPIHPRTSAALRRASITLRTRLIDPVGYLDMVSLIAASRVVLTDSGGLQKEAFFFRRPCVTLRDETEWTELVDGGFNRLAGADADTIRRAFWEAVESRPDFSANLYGNGDAGGTIATVLADQL